MKYPFTIVDNRDTNSVRISVTEDMADSLANNARNVMAVNPNAVKAALGEWSGSGTGHGPVPILGVGYVEWDSILHEVTVEGVLHPAEVAAELVAIGFYWQVQGL